MASSHLLSTTAALLLVFLLAAAPCTESAINCAMVVSDLGPCITFATTRLATVPPACCTGVKKLKAAAATPADRKAACVCIKTLLNKVNLAKAGTIPGMCGVSVGYPVSKSVNCATVS